MVYCTVCDLYCTVCGVLNLFYNTLETVNYQYMCSLYYCTLHSYRGVLSLASQSRVTGVDSDYRSDKEEGYTPSKPSTSDAPTFDEIRKLPHDFSKSLYFNPDQLGLLKKRLVVFLSDYGSGK